MKIELTSTDSRKRKFIVDQFPVIVGLDPARTSAWTTRPWAITNA